MCVCVMRVCGVCVFRVSCFIEGIVLIFQQNDSVLTLSQSVENDIPTRDDEALLLYYAPSVTLSLAH